MSSKFVKTVLDDWEITPEDFTELIRQNPSLRGMILGYLAEFKLRILFSNDPRISAMRKDDDHDRKRKGDLVVTYRGHEIVFESKSLQTNSIKQIGSNTFSGKYQCDASDRRRITMPNGIEIETTCLLFGEFDIVAVPLYGFNKRWDFAFALNRDLKPSSYKKYPEDVRQYLISSLQDIALPITPPYTHDIFRLMDTVISER